VLDARLRRQIEEREKAMVAAEAAPEMTDVERAQVQRRIAELLLPRETVTQALKRLGAAAGSRRPQGKRQKGDAQQPAGDAQSQALAKQQLEQLTEAASALMDSGELDVYGLHKVRMAARAPFGNPLSCWLFCSGCI
jgi:hypothetical protein